MVLDVSPAPTHLAIRKLRQPIAALETAAAHVLRFKHEETAYARRCAHQSMDRKIGYQCRSQRRSRKVEMHCGSIKPDELKRSPKRCRIRELPALFRGRRDLHAARSITRNQLYLLPVVPTQRNQPTILRNKSKIREKFPRIRENNRREPKASSRFLKRRRIVLFKV